MKYKDNIKKASECNADSTNLYNLELHDVLSIHDQGATVLRVPGGWIYKLLNGNNTLISSTFVPFNKEYIEDE